MPCLYGDRGNTGSRPGAGRTAATGGHADEEARHELDQTWREPDGSVDKFKESREASFPGQLSITINSQSISES